MRPFRVVAALTAAQLATPVVAWAAPAPHGYHTSVKITLGKGVTYQQFKSPRPEQVHVVTISPHAAVRPTVVLSNNRVAEPAVRARLELTTHACKRQHCVAGINGDYFCAEGHCPQDQFQPEGGVISDGKMLRSPHSVGWKERQLMFDRKGCPMTPRRLRWKGSVASYDLHRTLQLNGVNVDRGANQLILYTAAYGPNTLTNRYGDELVLKLRNRNWMANLGRVATAVPRRFVRHGHTRIRPGTIVLSGHGRKAKALRKFWRHYRHHAVQLRLDTYPAVWNSIGAKPLLLRHGHYTGQWFQPTPNPVTVVAWKPDCTRLLITGDGRQPGSHGFNTREAARLAASMGATTAFGMDNGGSTTMVGHGKLLNNPSDPGGERRVADSLLFVPARHRAAGRTTHEKDRPVVVPGNGVVVNLGYVDHVPPTLLEQLHPVPKGPGPARLVATSAATLVVGLLVGAVLTRRRRRRRRRVLEPAPG